MKSNDGKREEGEMRRENGEMVGVCGRDEIEKG